MSDNPLKMSSASNYGAIAAQEPERPPAHDFKLDKGERDNARAWVSKNRKDDSFWKDSRWSVLRFVLHLPKFIRAQFPTVQASIGGAVLGTIGTGVSFLGRAAQQCCGKPLPERVDVPLSTALDPSRKIKEGSLEDVQKNMKYTAAMQFAFMPYDSTNRKVLLSSDSADRVGKGDKIRMSTMHAMKRLGARDQWDYAVPTKNGFPPPADAKAQAFWRHLPAEIKDNINKHGVYADPRTGNVISILYDRKSGEIVIAHGGTGADPDADTSFSNSYKNTQHRSNVANWAGTADAPPSVKQSVAFGKLVREAAGKAGILDEHGEVNVVDVGNSRGGLMAQASALASHGRAVCTNSEQMGAATQRYVGLGFNRKKDASTKIVQLSHEHDRLSTQVGLRRAGQAFRFVTGYPTPANAGDFIALPGRLDPSDKTVTWGGIGHVDAFYQMVEAANQLGYQRHLLEDFETLRDGLRQPSETAAADNAYKYPNAVREAAAVCLQHMELGTLAPAFENAEQKQSFTDFLKQVADPDQEASEIDDAYRHNESLMWAVMNQAVDRVTEEMATKHENLIDRYENSQQPDLYHARHAFRSDYRGQPIGSGNGSGNGNDVEEEEAP